MMDRAGYVAVPQEEDKALHMVVTNVAEEVDTAGSIGAIKKEEKARHGIVGTRTMRSIMWPWPRRTTGR
jgi:hypothetical protein